MNDHEYFLSLLKECKLIDEAYGLLVPIINDELEKEDEGRKSEFIILFLIYFSLLSDGNITMSLNKDILLKKWDRKLEYAMIQSLDENESNKSKIENCFHQIRELSTRAIEECLKFISQMDLPSLIGPNRMFMVEDSYLYIQKYHLARKSILKSLDRLFSSSHETNSAFDYRKYMAKGRKLSDGQEEAVIKGVKKNLVITGGPGTGKTTSILFLLINLLYGKAIDDTIIYLVAPSGKASSRMKESIINSFSMIDDSFLEDPICCKIKAKLQSLEESTIHRLLGRDSETNGFLYNENNMFSKNSIFVIDEASMIDAALFSSLLKAIPDEARVYIMGDKNQLPSVDCGAVFGDLLIKESLKDNIVELTESQRFRSDTKIHALAKAINEGNTLPIKEEDFLDYSQFEIQPNDEKNNKEKPVFFYKDRKHGINDREIISYVCDRWGKAYYDNLQDLASDLDENDDARLNEVFSKTEFAKILCAANRGQRGVSEINRYIKKNFIDVTRRSSSFHQHFPGELMMINKNNRQLDLYNGDSGILVSFKDDDTLYFMVKKSSNLLSDIGKKKDRIFRLKNDYIFYPLRMISSEDIDLAYAITIHKSQGSDYRNILVILPDKKGHPLLNRQIVYTAITRTKGNTYILSSFERLDEAKDTVLIRDTNIA